MNLSKSEISKIEKILHIAIDKLIKGCETLNMDLAFEIFQDSPDFLMMGTDGTLCDYQTYLNNNFSYFEGCENFNLKTFDRQVRILDDETAVFSWSYGVEAKQKTGELDTIDNAGASFLFRKIDKEWKVVYYHESSVPMIRTSK